MPWVVGIDEAGYGPNLGPLAQAAVAVRLPAADPAGWAAVAPWCRRAGDRDKSRLLVDDSKLVHSGKNGFARLEHVATGLLGVTPGPVAGWLAGVGLAGVADDLAAEAWYAPDANLPVLPDPWPPLAAALAGAGLAVRAVGLKLVPAPVFNRVVAGSGSKGTVLAVGLVDLLAAIDGRLPAGEAVTVLADKQGGRAVYGHLLAAAFPAGRVVLEAETAAESRYRVDGLARPVGVAFRPEADAESVAVALASCLAKYGREVCMRQFNGYWCGRVPGLAATAGYPVDARRFYAAIQPAMAAAGVAADAVWRVK